MSAFLGDGLELRICLPSLLPTSTTVYTYMQQVSQPQMYLLFSKLRSNYIVRCQRVTS